jgi:hypothetical protein
MDQRIYWYMSYEMRYSFHQTHFLEGFPWPHDHKIIMTNVSFIISFTHDKYIRTDTDIATMTPEAIQVHSVALI